MRGGSGVLERTLHGDLAATWQQCASALGSPLVALAEVVTSMPGGAAQAWHQDGAGLTMQIALCKCGLAQGPTEVRPRPFRAEKLLALTRDRDEYSAFEPMARALHKLERPIYDGTGRLHAAFWEAVGPRLSREQAALGISAGVLPPPPSVRLTAEPERPSCSTTALCSTAAARTKASTRGRSWRCICATTPITARRDSCPSIRE